jgi:hypothetical protein
MLSVNLVSFALLSATAGAWIDDDKADRIPIVGRWDITVHGPAGTYPSWLEVSRSGYSTLVGSFVGRVGSARPISRVQFENGRVEFSLPLQWEEGKVDLHFSGVLMGDRIQGEGTDEKGAKVTWTAVRAPALKRERHPDWGESVPLIGKDLSGWKPRDTDSKNAWINRDSVLTNTAAGCDLVTERKFTDFKLHAEFRYPPGSNSGIYLRGRYEVQIEDNYGEEPESHKIGGIYGFLTPSVNAAKKPGEWQTFDVELVGRVVSVVFNGERIIDRQTIPGITGGALDSDEGAPGPIFLQGDHGPIEFRNIVITPAR